MSSNLAVWSPVVFEMDGHIAHGAVRIAGPDRVEAVYRVETELGQIEGSIAMPMRAYAAAVEAARRRLGALVFSRLLQQLPTPALPPAPSAGPRRF